MVLDNGKQTHQCDDRCRCPVHGTRFLYSTAGNEHACLDRDCKYGHGYERVADNEPLEGRVVTVGEDVRLADMKLWAENFFMARNEPTALFRQKAYDKGRRDAELLTFRIALEQLGETKPLDITKITEV